MCIEHPDHTGSSSNPLAPWNQAEDSRVICDQCEHEPDPGSFLDGETCLYERHETPCNGHYIDLEV